MLDPQDFDSAKPLILSRDARVNGHDMLQSEPASIVADESDERGKLTKEQATHLWLSGVLVYATRALATPVESPEQYARRTVEVDDLGDGQHLIRAPWLGEGVTVADKDLAASLEDIIRQGADANRRSIEGEPEPEPAPVAAGKPAGPGVTAQVPPLAQKPATGPAPVPAAAGGSPPDAA